MKRHYLKFTALIAVISTMLSGGAGCNTNVTPAVTTPTVAITAISAPTAEPTAEVVPSVVPTVEMTKEVLPTATPEVVPTEEVTPTEAPVVTEEVVSIVEPVATLTETVTSTVEPTSESTVVPEPTAMPAPTATLASTGTPKPAATLKPTPSPTPIPSVNGIKAGDYFTFGNYYQTRLTGDALTSEILNASYDAAGKAVINGKEYYKKPSKYYNQPNSPIGYNHPELVADEYHYFVKEPVEWQVLEVKDGMAFVISRYGLDRKQYHHEDDIDGDWMKPLKVTWEMCDLRFWLNTVFYNDVFSEEEQESILCTKIRNPDNTKYNVDGGNDTYDYLYVLSNEESERYFGKEKVVQDLMCGGERHDDYCNEKAYSQPTDYVRVQGVWNGSFPSYWDYPNCNYWLRTPGMDVNWVSYIDSGGILMNGMSTLVTGHLIVRPCMWIDLTTADIEK